MTLFEELFQIIGFPILLIALPFYITGTTLWNFLICALILLALFFLTKKFFASKRSLSLKSRIFISFVLFILVNFIPLPLAKHEWQAEIGEYVEGAHLGLGWPVPLAKYYYRDEDGVINIPNMNPIIDLVALAMIVIVGTDYLKPRSKS